MSEVQTAQQWRVMVVGGEQELVSPGQSVEIGRKPLRPLSDDGLKRMEVSDGTRSMSKRHAVFAVTMTGVASVRDLNSTNGSYVVGGDGGLMRLPVGVDFPLPSSPVRMQFGDVPVDFMRVETFEPEPAAPAVTDLFDYASSDARQEPDAADMSVDQILDLRAGEPTTIFRAQTPQAVPQISDSMPLHVGVQPVEEESHPSRDLFADAADVAAASVVFDEADAVADGPAAIDTPDIPGLSDLPELPGLPVASAGDAAAETETAEAAEPAQPVSMPQDDADMVPLGEAESGATATEPAVDIADVAPAGLTESAEPVNTMDPVESAEPAESAEPSVDLSFDVNPAQPVQQPEQMFEPLRVSEPAQAGEPELVVESAPVVEPVADISAQVPEDDQRFRPMEGDVSVGEATQAFTPAFEAGSVFERVSNGDFDAASRVIEIDGMTSEDAKRTTDFTLQFEMARHEELQPFLAMNPSLYDDLYAWLAAQGNRDVDEALAHNEGYRDYLAAVGK